MPRGTAHAPAIKVPHSPATQALHAQQPCPAAIATDSNRRQQLLGGANMGQGAKRHVQSAALHTQVPSSENDKVDSATVGAVLTAGRGGGMCRAQRVPAIKVPFVPATKRAPWFFSFNLAITLSLKPPTHCIQDGAAVDAQVRAPHTLRHSFWGVGGRGQADGRRGAGGI